MKKAIILFLNFFVLTGFAQIKTATTLKLDIPKTGQEPQTISFPKENNSIVIDGKKCFDYQLYHDFKKNEGIIQNYYEIKSLNGELLFSGNISNANPSETFEDEIIFYPFEEKIYKNANIVGRNALILNLSSNQVLNKDCSLNLDHLKLFYEQSNEYK